MAVPKELLADAAFRVASPLFQAGIAPGVVAFDADGTLWRGDVGEDFLRYLAVHHSLPRFGPRGVYEEYEHRVAINPALGYAFAVEVMVGMEETKLQALCRDFFQSRYLGRIFPYVRPILAGLHKAGHSVWIVSASPRWIVEAGAEGLGLSTAQVIGVNCDVVDGRLAGAVHQPVPCGQGKVDQLKSRGLKPLLAAGNGELDLPMLEYSERALVVAPHGEPGNGLVSAAVARGWEIQRG